jgi:hypothetical protein
MDFMYDYASRLIEPDRVEQITEKKASILDEVFVSKGVHPNCILSLTFNLVIIDFALQGSDVTFISENQLAIDYAKSVTKFYDLNIKCYKMDFVTFCIQAHQNNEKYDVVLGLDQYFTYAESENEQRDKLHHSLELVDDSGMLLTTLIDYKNLRHNNKIFTDPHFITSNNGDHILISNRQWDIENRKQWVHHSYAINQTTCETVFFPPIIRQAMFFKQIAFHTSAVGWTSFTVHKNKLYKPLYNNHGQYIISIMR